MSNREAMLPEMPDFEDFYRAVYKRPPFPWQARLARQVRRQGEWPTEIGIPTGLGKTACMDIAVWCLASQAELAPEDRSAPTRIWWVVNRRLLVDMASQHALHLSDLLTEPQSARRSLHAKNILGQVGSRLASIAAPEGYPLHAIRMRGGITLRRPPNPAQPSVIVSTIPMYGSRLLFRGLGSSRSMRPIDAALAGTDSLVLIDEAHLARHLRDLIPKLQECVPESANSLLPGSRSTPQIVSMTATGDATAHDRFEIDETDKAHEIIRLRLKASKPTEINDSGPRDVAKALQRAVTRLLSNVDSPASCVVFCNTPAVARAAHSLLVSDRKIGPKADVMLLTGRMRQADADRARDRLMSPVTGAPAASVPNNVTANRERHLIVVATQTLEVGADLDFEYLVSEQCGVRALTQRLGRLNRLGNHPHARAVYVHRPPPKKSRSSADKRDGWPVYGTEPKLVLDRLLKCRGFEDDLDLNPGGVADILGKPNDDAGRAPEILAELLWEWVKTTTPPIGMAPVEPYFSGISTPQARVSVLWRAHVPTLDRLAQRTSGVGNGEKESIDRRKRLWPRVSSDETVEVPVWELRDAMRQRGIERIVRRSKDRGFLELVRLDKVRPGDLVVIESDKGLYDRFGWAPEATQTVEDLSIWRSGLPLDRTALERLLGSSLQKDNANELYDSLEQARGKIQGGAKGQQEPEELDEDSAREGAQRLIALLRDIEDAPCELGRWDDFLDGLEMGLRTTASLAPPPHEIARIELRKSAESIREDELDEMSLADSLPPQSLELVAHGCAVGERAAQVATALGLPGILVDVIRRAGSFHDIGKVDERFQRWLNPNDSPGKPGYVPAAKSAMAASNWSAARKAAGWPRGGRHEELSARLVRAWLAGGDRQLLASQEDLLVHLVVSHHGKGRPLVPPVADGSWRSVGWDFANGETVSASADLSETDWGQPARFRRLNTQYGPWGVAMLEAVVRQADHEVSAGTVVHPTTTGRTELEVR